MSDSKVYMVPDGTRNSIDPALMVALSQNGGFGGGAGWMWPMFMWMMFPWLFNGMGYGGFGGGINGGAGFLANQLNNDAGRDLLLQAINGRADALTGLAGILNTDVNNVQSAVNAVQSAVQTVGASVGLSGQQVINSVQAGNASLSQQLCQCCCENRLAVVEQTNQLQSQAASNYAAIQLEAAKNAAAANLQASQIEAADQLAVCQQTNALTSQADRNSLSALATQADRNSNSILNAIAAQNTLITKEFCDLKERELQNKINTQGDIITQLRGQISNDAQTRQFTAAFQALDDKIDTIAAKQPNTVPVTWPNLTAVNNTPYAGGFYGYYGNGFGNSIVF